MAGDLWRDLVRGLGEADEVVCHRANDFVPAMAYKQKRTSGDEVLAKLFKELALNKGAHTSFPAL